MTTLVSTGQITITDVNDGYNASLTTPSIVLAADAAGTILSYIGAETYFKILLGTQDLTSSRSYYVSAIGTGISYRDSNDTADRTGIGVTNGLLDGTAGYLKIVNLTADSSYVEITAAKVGEQNIIRTLTVARTKAGAVSTTPGPTGAQTHRAYVATTNNTTPPATPAATTNGAVPTTAISPAVGTTWSLAVATVDATNTTQWQTDGVTPANSTVTTWSAPYLSYFKVANLSAITANLGTITAGSISGTSLTIKSRNLLACGGMEKKAGWAINTTGGTTAAAAAVSFGSLPGAISPTLILNYTWNSAIHNISFGTFYNLPYSGLPSYTAGVTYTVSFYASGSYGYAGTFTVSDSISSAWTVTPITNPNLALGTWQRYVFTIVYSTAPTTPTLIVTGLSTTSSSFGGIYFSNFQIEEGSAVTAWVSGGTPVVYSTGVMNGTGAILNTDGTFAIGNAANSIVNSPTSGITINGPVVFTANINNNAVSTYMTGYSTGVSANITTATSKTSSANIASITSGAGGLGNILIILTPNTYSSLGLSYMFNRLLSLTSLTAGSGSVTHNSGLFRTIGGVKTAVAYTIQGSSGAGAIDWPDFGITIIDSIGAATTCAYTYELTTTCTVARAITHEIIGFNYILMELKK